MNSKILEFRWEANDQNRQKKKLMAFGFLKNNEKFYKDLKRVNVKKSYF